MGVQQKKKEKRKSNKVVHLNLIQHCGDAVQMWYCAETENWILPPGARNSKPFFCEEENDEDF